MISGKNLFRTCLLLLVVLCGVTAVSAWTLQNWSATAQTSPAQPGTPVSLHYDIHFDSWTTGTTFDSANSLVMVTDLANPQWTVTTTETMDDGTQIVTPMPVRQSMQVRLVAQFCQETLRSQCPAEREGPCPEPVSEHHPGPGAGA
jgi:hypothetical protein